MPLDEATRRLAFLLQRDLRRLVERERARSDRGEEVRYDSVSRMATWETRRGDVIGRWYGEIIASYVLKDRMLRWAWAGRASLATATHAEVVFREGQSRGAPQLSMSLVGDIDEDDACTLARLGVLVARGEGMQLLRSETEIAFVGLFDSPRPRELREDEVQDPSRYSVPPPPAIRNEVSSSSSSSSSSQTISTPPPRHENSPNRQHANQRARSPSSPPPAYRSLPPIREIYGPHSRYSSPPQAQGGGETDGGGGKPKQGSVPPPPAPLAPSRMPALVEEERKVREPARLVFLPVANAVVSGLTRVVPRFRQALFILTIIGDLPSTDQQRRLVVMLVAVDAAGILRQVDPSSEILDASVRMIEADQADGNGRWRKLSARITPKPDGGATLNVDVL